VIDFFVGSSVIALWVLVSFDAWVLRDILHVALEHRELVRKHVSSLPRPRGSKAPKIQLTELENGLTRTIEHFVGTTLLFVAGNDLEVEQRASLAIAMPHIRKRTNGNLAVVCSGDLKLCRELLPDLISEAQLPETGLFLDSTDSVARKLFRLESIPSVVRLDESGRILEHGYQRSARQA